MTGAQFARRWAALYTRGLPASVADRRREELAGDVHEHLAAGGRGPAIVGRTVRGIPADVLWHFDERRAMSAGAAAVSGRPAGLRAAWATLVQAWFTPIAALVGVFNVMLAVGVLRDPEGTMPGRVVGPVVLTLLAIAMGAGLHLRWAARFGDAGSRPSSGYLAMRAAGGLAALAVAVGAVGLVGVIGGAVTLVLAVGVVLLATRRSSGPRPAPSVLVADVLIIVGTLPSLVFFWLVFPTVLALIVIAGVIGTGPGTRRRAATLRT